MLLRFREASRGKQRDAHWNEWYASRNESAGRNTGGLPGGQTGGPSPAVPRMGGAAGQATARQPDALGDQGVPQPTYDAEARDRYDAARSASANRVATFDKGAW